MTFKTACLVCMLISCLAGCAADPASQAMLDAYRLTRTESVAEHANLDLTKGFKYIRVQVEDRELFMVLGYVDSTPDGPVEVWYSSDADVLHLRDGRVVGATLKRGTDWSAVSFSHLPAWSAVGKQAEFSRTHDESPGYRYSIHELMLIKRIVPPDDSNLKNISPASVTWFEEAVQAGADDHPSRYAVNLQGAPNHQVVYAEQCLSSEFCFSWQSWPYSGKGTP